MATLMHSTTDSRVTVFACERPGRREACTELRCDNRAVLTCDFALAGKRAGQTCGRQLCAKHGKKGLCGPHARFLVARGARAA